MLFSLVGGGCENVGRSKENHIKSTFVIFFFSRHQKKILTKPDNAA